MPLPKSLKIGSGILNKYGNEYPCQWETELEKTLMTTTPAMIRASPMMAARSRCCLKTKKPISAIRMIPTPDQMA